MQGNPELLRLLGQIDPHQPYGHELFNALARLMPTVAVEAVCLSPSLRGTEILLTQRKANESYPSQWHCPGSILRIGEEFEDVFKRLEQHEFGCQLLSKEFIGNLNNPEEVRGHGLSMVYLCEVEAEPPKGQWFLLDNLPENMVSFHRDHLIPFVLENLEI